MSRRLVILIAFALAAAVAVVAFLASDPDLGPQNDITYAPSEIPTELNPGELGSKRLSDIVGETGESSYSTQEGQGADLRRTVFSWDKAEPTRAGATDVIGPQALILMGNPLTRVIRIQADRGQFVAPEQDVRSGRFEGNVILTLYDQPDPDTLLDFETDQHVTYRVFLDKPARFDVDYAEVRSAGPVLLTGPTAEFKGQGLTVKYNRLRSRIEELTIEQGQTLRLRQDALPGQRPTPEQPAQPNPQNNPQSETPTAPTDIADTTQPTPTAKPPTPDANPPTRAEPAKPTPAAPPSQFYLARFLDNVQVEVPDNDATLTGFALDLRFSLGTPRKTTSAPTVRKSTPPSHIQLALNQTAPAEPARVNEPPPPTPTITRSLFTPDPSDIRVTWTGPLTLRPLAASPDDLTHPQDLTLQLQGNPNTPAHLQRLEQSITADRVGFHRATATFTAQGDAQRPAFLNAPDMGTLKVRQLTLDPSTATGWAQGPGTLTTRQARPEPATPNTTNDPAPPLTLDFARRLDLTFFTKPQPANAGSQSDQDSPSFTAPDRLSGIRAAEFVGSVKTRHPDFKLDTDRLVLEFREMPETPADGQDQPDPMIQTLRAVGNARLQTLPKVSAPTQPTTQPGPTARPDASPITIPPRLDLAAQAITLDFANDPASPDQPIPTTLRAFREVRALYDTTDLSADRLDVNFTQTPRPADTQPTSATQPTTRPADPSDTLRIAALTASGSVIAKNPPEGLTLRGSTLIVLPDDQRLTVLGEPRAPASIQQRELTLTGQSIFLDQTEQTVRADQPGSLTVLTDPLDPAAQFSVAWQRSMLLNNARGQARFLGEVNTRSTSATETTHLTTEDLALTFAPYDTLDDPDTDAAASSSPTSPPLANLRTVVARGGPGLDQRAILNAQQHRPGQPDQPQQRLRLEGPTMTFTQAPPANPADPAPNPSADPTQAPTRAAQTLRVPGPGLLLLEDYSSADQDDDNVELTGRGVTLFTFQDHLFLDAVDNDLTLVGDVSMVHRPQAPQANQPNQPGPPPRQPQTARLWTDRLTVDITQTQALTRLTTASPHASADPPKPASRTKAAIRTVTATGQVVLEQEQKRLTADHLLYEALQQTVTLWADNQAGDVTVSDPAQVSDLRARRILWNLGKDEIKVLGARGGIAPIAE